MSNYYVIPVRKGPFAKAKYRLVVDTEGVKQDYGWAEDDLFSVFIQLAHPSSLAPGDAVHVLREDVAGSTIYWRMPRDPRQQIS